MLSKCAWQWFYIYYDNKDNMCKCHNGYLRNKWKIGCFKN